MAITLKTITGKIVIPGTTTGIRATVTATPMTTAQALNFPDDDTLTWGPVVGTTDVAGNLPATFKIPTNSAQQVQDLVWRFTAEPIDKHTGLPKVWTMGYYEITGTGTADLADLVVIDITAIPTSVYIDIQALVASASASASSASASATTSAAGAQSAAASATLAQTLVTSDLGTTDGQTRALIEDPNSQTSRALALYSDLPALLAGTGSLATGSLVLTRAEKYAYVVEPVGSTDYHLTTAGGVLLRVSNGNQVVAPVMFGALGDGVTDDLDAVQTCWTWAGARGIPVDMQGLEYNCAGAVTTRSNLTIHARGAVMYATSWPTTGAFVSNVDAADPLARVQSNIRIHDLIVDGSKLPAPSSTENCNLLDFARGASDVRVTNCTARYMRRGYGGGTGGSGFGGEQGLDNVIFDGCIVHDCFRGARVAGLPGNHADAAAEAKRAIGVIFRDLTIKNCSAAIFGHSVGEDTGDTTSDLSVFDALFDGVYIEDCGHAAWSDLDYGTYPTIVPQKSGVLVFAGAQNIRMRGVRVKINSDYTTRADWLGRSGYPGAGTNYISAGLTGNVGALVWGWGRNIVIEDMTLDGVVDCARRLARCPALGEIATTPPGRNVAPNEQNRISMAQVGGSGLAHVVDGWRTSGGVGLDNTYTNEVVIFSAASGPATAVVSAEAIPSGGLAGITNLQVELKRFNGSSLIGTAAQWLSDPSVTLSVAGIVRKDGAEFGGGYSSTGTKDGLSYDPAGILRTSRSVTANAPHEAFYNPNGNVGGIYTEDSSTRYYVTSSRFVSGGAGSPEGVVTANPGSLWLRTDGGAGTTFYVKETGTGNTGWVAK